MRGKVKGSALIAAGIGAVGGTVAVVRRGRRDHRRAPGQPPPEPITPSAARDKAAELLALPRIRRRDEAMSFAPTTVTSVELLLHGRRYFPRILEDIAAARDHIHMLFYAIRPGTTADAFVDALAERASAGLEVKIAVDAIGSGVDTVSREPLPPAARGRRGDRRERRDRDRARRPDRVAPRHAPRRGRPPLRPPQDDGDRRSRGVRRWDRDRGPLRGRPIHRRHVPRHGAGRVADPARVPCQLGEGRRAQAARPDRPVPRRRSDARRTTDGPTST